MRFGMRTRRGRRSGWIDSGATAVGRKRRAIQLPPARWFNLFQNCPLQAPGFVSGGPENRGAFGARLRARLRKIPARDLIFPARDLTVVGAFGDYFGTPPNAGSDGLEVGYKGKRNLGHPRRFNGHSDTSTSMDALTNRVE